MATVQSLNPLFSSPIAFSTHRPHAPPLTTLSFTTRSTSDDSSSSSSSDTTPEPTGSADSFEDRLSQVRLRYRSGTGKKAEVRKGKKSGTGKKSGGANNNIYLPPVPLKEPVSGGLKVDFGFSPYSERINGRVAALGLTALLLVELATGKSVINYHSPAIVFIQVYFMAAVTALYCKFEKEKVSVWPQ